MVLYSHPNKLLFDHLKHVGNNSHDLISKLNINLDINVKFLADLSALIGFFHDFGKASEEFQYYITTGEIKGKKDHAELSALAFVYFIENYFEKIRCFRKYIGEDINGILYKEFAALSGFLCIINHHTGLVKDYMIDNLDNYPFYTYQNINSIKNKDELANIYYDLLEDWIDKNDLNDFIKKFFLINEETNKNLIKQVSDKIYKFSNRGKDLSIFFIIKTLFSVLILSDRIDASSLVDENRSIAEIDMKEKILSYYNKEFSNNDLNENKRSTRDMCKIRNDINRAIDKYISSNEFLNELKEKKIIKISLPTGYGKTLIGLKLAAKVIETLEKPSKLFYVLPFLSIIDQTQSILNKVFDKNSIIRYDHISKNSNDESNQEASYAQNDVIYETLSAPIILTTFVSFFNFLINGEKKNAMKFSRIINSVVIIDEIQAIPIELHTFLKDNIEFLANKFNIRFNKKSRTFKLSNPKRCRNF